jgi:SAM-dependent methyltransferase
MRWSVFAAARTGETVLDVGCGCGAPTLEFARAVGRSGHVVGMDISGPMLAEGAARAKAADLANVVWRQDDPATAELEGFDLLVSAFGVMFFGDMVGAFTNMRRAAKPAARMALVCWRGLAENPWMELPMKAVAQHLPPRPKGTPNAPGMFAFANPEYVSEVFTAAGWSPPRFKKFDQDLDIAAGRGLEEAVVQSKQIGAVNSWAARSAGGDYLRCHPITSRGAGAACGWRLRSSTRRNVVDQQRGILSAIQARPSHFRPSSVHEVIM